MKNFGVEERTIPESREEPATSGSSSRSSSTEGGKKLRFGKLWVCKRGSSSPISRTVKSGPRRASDVLRGLNDIEKYGSVSKEEAFTQTYFDRNSTIDASTETIDAQLKKAVADAGVSCRCETVSASSGPDEFVEIRCVNRSRSSAVQTDAPAESARSAMGLSKRDKRRCRSILSGGSSTASPEEVLEADEDIEADLIYDGMKRCFPYPIEVTVKPKYVATCESCESSTDKRVSISHGGLDAAVGSFIIIDASLEEADGRRVSLDESYQRSVSCEVCDDCVELGGETRSRAWQSLDETGRSSHEESGQKNRQRGRRDTSVGDESRDGDWAEESSFATQDDTGGSADRRGPRSTGRDGRSSSVERRSGRSRIYGEEDSRSQDESSTFWKESTSGRLDDRQRHDDTGGSRSAHRHGRSSSGGGRSSTFWKESTSSRLDGNCRNSSIDGRSGRSVIYDKDHSRPSDESSTFFKSPNSWLDDRRQHDDTGGSRSAHRHERSSSDDRRSRRSVIYAEEPGRQPDESSTFRKQDTSFWLDDHDRRRSALVPLHESSRLSLRILDKTGENSRAPSQIHDVKLHETSTRSKKPHGLTGRQTNIRTEDIEEIVTRRRKPRTSETPINRGLGVAAIARCRALDEKEPLFGCKREKPFVFEIRNLRKPAILTNEFPRSVSKNCWISEFNNFGKRYDWDRTLDPADKRKYCKCGNGCGGLNSGNKCCCRE